MARDPDNPREDPYPGPPHRVREGDNLWYLHPNTGERFLSVTSALERLGKEDLDYRWRPGLTAQAAFNRLPELVAATLTPDCGQTYGKCSRSDTRQHDWRVACEFCPCGKCQPCLVKSLTYEHYRESARATDRGSAFHHWVEDWSYTKDGNVDLAWQLWRTKCGRQSEAEVKAWEEQTRPYVDSFLRFVDDFGLTVESWLMAEATVINRTHMWGGTLDARVQFSHKATPAALELCERIGSPAPVLSLDTKTREKGNATFWPDNALQLAAYRRGEHVLLPDGTEEPLRPDDGALVVQVRPDGYGWRIMVTDDKTYAGFLGILTAAYWLINDANESTLVRAHPRNPLPGVEPAAPKKRAARKTAVPAVSSDRAGDLAAATGRGLVDAELPLADVKPARPAVSNATLDSMRARAVSPDSLYQDEVPF